MIGRPGKVGVSVVFGFEEIWKNVFVGPSLVALGFPLVVVEFVASDVDHSVQNAGSSKHLGDIGLVFDGISC